MSAQPHLHPIVRPLGPEDLDDVIQIEEASYPWPWTRGIFADCIRVGYCCSGLQIGSDLAGYCIVSMAAGEAHLLNLCVHPDWQSHGLGSLMLEHAIGQARLGECESMFLEVRPSNPGAARLYLKRGFREIGVRPDYYRAGEGREDAIVLEMRV